MEEFCFPLGDLSALSVSSLSGQGSMPGRRRGRQGKTGIRRPLVQSVAAPEAKTKPRAPGVWKGQAIVLRHRVPRALNLHLGPFTAGVSDSAGLTLGLRKP